jgi:tRNA (mo5U34)-methyltransferase
MTGVGKADMELQLDDPEAVLARARELSPWHFDYEILPGTNTGSLNRPDYADPSKQRVAIVDPGEMRTFFQKYYPSGLAGKTMLDVACNSGGYCFLSYTLGVERVVGIEVRQHWLDQAEFIRSVKYPDSRNVEFRLQDVQEYLKSAEDNFDITIFKGIFYHLPDPIGVLDRLCGMTRETIVIDTASSDHIPEACLTAVSETRNHVMSGIHGLAWLPGGPAAIKPILSSRGFNSTEVAYWRHNLPPAGRGRFRMIGSRLSPPIR